jgi:GNAT superfamily N-acetyltransferase
MVSQIMSIDLTRKIEAIEISYTRSRLEGMQNADVNPLGIITRNYGNGYAFLIKQWPDFWYGNRVLGLESSDEKYIDEIADFFRNAGLDFRFEFIPGNLSLKMAAQLHKRGFFQGSFSAALYGSPQLMEPPLTENVIVKEVRESKFDLFLDIYQDGFDLPRLDMNEKATATSWLLGEKDLVLSIAEIDGVPASVSILFMKDDVAMLADFATLPQFRGEGCQTALMRYQISQTIEKECKLLVSFVEFGSASHRNMERAGLKIAYTKSLWFSSS